MSERSEGTADLATDVVRLATSSGTTVAVAESLTAGMLCARIADVPGASVVLRGGVVAYAPDLKTGLLGVDPTLLADRGPVDPDVALAMASGVRGRLGADVGVATTGVAGPGPQDGVAAGTVYVAVSRDDRGDQGPRAVQGPNGDPAPRGVQSPRGDQGLHAAAHDAESLITGGVVRRLAIEGDRATVRAGATEAALTLLRAVLRQI